MATIIKRKKNYSVVYYYDTPQGEKKQKWETFTSYKDANKRKVEIENQQENGTFIAPTSQTVEDFLYDFVTLYGEKKWGLTTYDSNLGLISNYINPIIGSTPIQKVNRKFVDSYYKTLTKTKPVIVRNRKPKSEFLPPATIEKIFKLLSTAFKQAVKWELVGKNPFQLSDALPRTKYKKRDIWTAESISKALNSCKDGKLYVAINLAFACSMREGEILGLTWDLVNISDEAIAEDNAYIDIKKELLRVSKRALETLDQKDVYYIFPPLMPNTSTRVVLKKPKNDTSIRRVWIPKTLAYILRDWKKAQDELVQAQIQENDQYEAMKLRIKYMYENGNASLLEILFSAKSMGDLLNKAEYVQSISEYDRNMLEKYEKLTKEIEEKEAALEKEEEELKTLQNDLIAKRNSVNQLLAEKEVQISSLEDQIGANAAKLQELIKEAEEAKRRQEEAAAAKRAAEEAARKAALAAQQAASSSGSSSGSGSSSAGNSHVSGNGSLAYPVASPRITSGYGYRTAPTAGATSRHDGIDFGGATGTPIYASAAGTVVTAAYNSARGNYVVINHGNGLQTWYQHCSAVYVSVGQKVSKGQNIAAIGSTGIVTGPHLHYEVHVNGTPVNPLNYL